MTKIDIFSGFLGAGKTTLIKKLIAEAYSGEKLEMCIRDRQKIVKMAQVLGRCFHIAALSRLIIGAEKASAYYSHLLYHTSR